MIVFVRLAGVALLLGAGFTPGTVLAADPPAAQVTATPGVESPAPAEQPPRKVRGYLYDAVELSVPHVCEAAGNAQGAACEESCFVEHSAFTCVSDRDELETMLATPEDRIAADALFDDCLEQRHTTRDLVARCVVACVERRGGHLCRSVVPGPQLPLKEAIAADSSDAPAREWFLHADALLGALFGSSDPEATIIPVAARLRAGLTVRGWDFRTGALAQGGGRFALGLGIGKSLEPVRFGTLWWTPLIVGVDVFPSTVAFNADVMTGLRFVDRRNAPYGGKLSWILSFGLTGYVAGYPTELMLGPTVAFGAELGL